MRRIVLGIGGTLTGVVLLFIYPTSTGHKLVANGGALPLTSPTTAPAPGSTVVVPTGAPGGSRTFDGAAADTAYGPVQVQITVSAGKITAARVLQVPQESSRDVRINSQAVPILDQEVVRAQSAQIDSVSGASYTSDGYVRSLQSAIDAAHL